MDMLSDVAQMIATYTEQLERYEALSTWCALLTVICILAVIIFAGSLIVKGRNGKDTDREGYHFVLTCLFLTIPSITTLYLYIFAMNMRKVALFRGYLGFLENQWNVLAGSDIMRFNLQIIDRYFSPQVFPVNGLGPAVMALFLALSLVFGFGMAIHFAGRLQTPAMKRGLKLLTCVLGVICLLFNGMCCYYLTTNDAVLHSVLESCGTKLQK